MLLNFISGLPRSGSTLLASLLRQNPTVHASVQSPLAQAIVGAATDFGPENEGHMLVSDKQRRLVVRGMFYGFYEDAPEVVFDNNRRWCANMGLLAECFPKAIVICCVRPPVEIVESFERLFQTHQIEPSRIYGAVANRTVYERVETLLDKQSVVGWSLGAAREAYFGVHRSMLHMIEYADLCTRPQEVMDSIHERLKLVPFAYDFKAVKQIPEAELYDLALGTPHLHSLRRAVESIPREPCLPPDIRAALPPPFWR